MSDKINISLRKHKLLVYIVLIIAALMVYWQVSDYTFVNMNDYSYITDNAFIRLGISSAGIIRAFSTVLSGLWQPMVWLSFLLDYHLFSMNPASFHMTNLVLHILSTLLIFWLFCRLTGAVWKSAFVAALFALHPLHVESVAWISGRKDVLGAFFWMLTLCLYVYYTQKEDMKKYLMVFICFVCASMSNPMAVSLPVVMLLLDYWPLKRFESHKENLVSWQFKEKIPFFILSAVFFAAMVYTQSKMALLAKSLPFASRALNFPVSLFAYLEKTFWPRDLAVFYPFPEQLPLWQVAGALFLFTAISIAVFVLRKRLPYIFAGWFWYAITLLPAIGMTQISFYGMADRYTYLPLTGAGIVLAWGIPSLINNKDIRRNILFPAAIIIFMVMAMLAWKQCATWKNSVTLHEHALKVTKDNFIAFNGLGNALSEEGIKEESVYYYNEAIRLKPDFADPYNNRGNVYLKLEKYPQAIESYNEAIRLKPGNAIIHNNRGNAYAGLGQYKSAFDDFNEASRLQPNNSDACINRSIVNFVLGNRESGCLEARKACQLGDCRILKAAQENGDCL